LLRKQRKTLGGYFFCRTLYATLAEINGNTYRLSKYTLPKLTIEIIPRTYCNGALWTNRKVMFIGNLRDNTKQKM